MGSVRGCSVFSLVSGSSWEEEASFGSEGGFGFCEDSWRARVIELNPTVRKDEISGVGGIRGSDGSSSSACFFASWRLRFLLLFPLDLVRWFARCWPMGESRLQNRTRRLSTSRFQRRERIGRSHLQRSSSMVSWSWNDTCGL